MFAFKNKNRIKSISIMKHMRMRRVACGELLTFAYLITSVSFATHNALS